MRIWQLVACICFILLFNACNNDPLNVDTSHLKPNLTFKRLDQDLFALNPAAGKTDTKQLRDKYGDFLYAYSQGVLRLGDPESESYPYAVAQFITDESMKTLFSDVDAEFSDLTAIEEEFEDAFSRYMYHFPDSTIPEIIFHISAINVAVSTTQNTLGIALDMFLGSDYPVYPMVGLPKYLYKNMKPNQVVPQAVKGWVQSMYETNTTKNTLVENMIFEGKLLYAMDALLAETPEEDKIGFTPEELEWCTMYEARVWAHLIEEELLYDTEYMTINKWINQAPFVSGIPKDSPGRLGQWVGHQIVKKYMQNNPETTLTSLMANQNAQEILTQSKYKPKR